MRPPRFDELVGDDLDDEDRARLRRAHEALVTAGPPPELSERLLRAPAPPAAPLGRRRLAGLALAAALAAAAFAGGWLYAGGERVGFGSDFVLAMEGTEAAPAASARLVVGEIDAAGNWPMAMEVNGLPDGRYELLLTKDGEPAASCGTFLVEGETVAYLNAPYRLREFDGWVVVPEGSERVVLATDEV